MATPYTHKKLTEVKDSAPEFGLGADGEARFAKDDLDGEDTGVSHHRVKPGKRQPFGHRHDKAEEIYVVLAGEGTVKLGDELRPVRPLDAIRIAPEVPRAFEAGPDGLELLVGGAHDEGDGEPVDDDWVK